MAGTLRPMAALLSLLILVLLSPSSHAAAPLSIGVNYGTLADNLPPPAQVAAFLKDRTSIDRVKLFDCNPDILRAFAGTGVSLLITAPNGVIPTLSRLSGARAWVAANVAPFYPSTNISLIAVGNEIMASGDRNLIARLVPAMRSLSSALSEAGFPQIRVSTPHSLGILSSSDPPSSGRFRRGYDRAIFSPMLDFHRRTKTPFIVNTYPYFGYSDRTLDYALFKPNQGIRDPVTRITYTNMFDAQMDAVFSAMNRLGFGDVEIAVGETGWPSAAEPGQAGVSPAFAAEYNGNLIRHVSSGKGTPLMPNRKFETYIFALFNENLKPGPIAERNFGLFRPDFTPVYDAGVLRGGSQGAGAKPAPRAAGKWCVAKGGASEAALNANIEFACGTAGVDCRPINAGGPCFEPNTAQAHASYAMNAYYKASGRHDFNCDFSQTGVIMTSDPSYGDCKF
ncbi:Glucan endo-1,3-beta-glucosidase [Apostasia shenzhenica]|uniref:glucan endo-1,3-beta-D-glucosidase n=1 Tax=Apostasia shenzhenica TaxID=1088818 RepID=A0A2H9ZZ34_9ASPA|nr:Glucan endo-1,3-beta-glucosidase [Apostasia shenzhenica]